MIRLVDDIGNVTLVDDISSDVLTDMAISLIKMAAGDTAVADEMFEVNGVGFSTARMIAFGFPACRVSELRKDALHNLYAAYFTI
jgi:hypothetical protein